MADLPIGNVPTSTLNDTDNMIFAQGSAPKKIAYGEIKKDILGNETLATTTETIKGLINEIKGLADSNTTSLSELANKNWCMNGGFDIWQRGANFSALPVFSYLPTADRFLVYSKLVGTMPSITHSRQAVTNGEIDGVKNFYRVTIGSGGGANVNDLFGIFHPIENGTKKLCGTGKKITVSFMARSSIVNKKIGLRFEQYYGTGGTPTPTETLSGKYFTLTSNWAKYFCTIDTNTLNGKTFGTNDDDYFRMSIILAYGSNFAGDVGDTVGEGITTAGTIDIAKIKIETGSIATPFVSRLYGEELALCQRYYEKSEGSVYVGTIANNDHAKGNLGFKSTKRTQPTLSVKADANSANNTVYATINGVIITGVVYIDKNGAIQFTAPGAFASYIKDLWSCYWEVDAEIY